MTTITTGLSFDFFIAKNTQENSRRTGGHCLWSALRVGGRILAGALHGGTPQHAAGQHSAARRNHARGFVPSSRI